MKQDLFYQKMWNVVGPQITRTCLSILNGQSSAAPLSVTNLALIPKVKNPRKVIDYRPISLCNVLYKFSAKAIVNRLKHVLNTLISENQSAFVRGRLIVDNVAVGFESMHSRSTHHTGKKWWMSMKLDMNKVYERV